MLTIIAGFIAVASAQQRATTAADLAVLAAADSARGLRPGQPCQLAQTIAEANGAQLTACAQPSGLPGVVDARVQVEIPAPYQLLGKAEAISRAGPPPAD